MTDLLTTLALLSPLLAVYFLIVALSWREAYRTLAMQRRADLDEAAETYETQRVEIEALRCSDLGAYFDGELSPGRRDAFEEHLTRCRRCADGLVGLMQETAIVDWAPQQCTAAIACPRDDCGAARGERCKTDRPLHHERWDAWKAAGFRSSCD